MSIEVIVTVIIFVLGLVGVLIKIIRDHDLTRITKLEEATAEAQTKVAMLEGAAATTKELAEKQLEELLRKLSVLERHQEQMATKHDDNGRRFGNALEQVKDHIGDIRETIAGFGSTYVTRREYQDDRR